MIPLRSSIQVSRIHFFVYLILAMWTFAQLSIWVAGQKLLVQFAMTPVSFSALDVLRSIPFHESLLSTIVSLLYFWVFGPPLFEIFKPKMLVFFSCISTVFVMWIFSLIHSNAGAPILSSEAFLGFFLGAFMRKDIWGTVDTLVIGPLWLRVFSVPSYVLLFFWFFYLLLGNLVMDPPFADAPMLYLIPLLGFLSGFLYASFSKTLILKNVALS